MNWNHKASKVLITGQSGTGKTTLWLGLLKNNPARWKWVFDPDRETAHKLRWPVATAANQLAWFSVRCRPVCYDPTDQFPGDRPAGFDFFCSWVMAFVRARDPGGRPLVNGPKLVAVDELQDYTETGKGGLPLSFRTMLDAGRREEVDLLLIAQRLGEVNHVVPSQLTGIESFQHTDPLALAWLADRGFDPEQVASLPRFHSIVLNTKTRETLRRNYACSDAKRA